MTVEDQWFGAGGKWFLAWVNDNCIKNESQPLEPCAFTIAHVECTAGWELINENSNGDAY